VRFASADHQARRIPAPKAWIPEGPIKPASAL